MTRNNLHEIYAEIKGSIMAQQDKFLAIWARGNAEEFFRELVFCILTPQSGAFRCWQAVENLMQKDYLFKGNTEEISSELNIVRFKNKKARYIVEARSKLFNGNKLTIKDHLSDCDSINEMRDWLTSSVKGLGLKEASHYLRNVGKGEDIAILDRHILKNMASYKLIDKIPTNVTNKLYLRFEEMLRGFSRDIGIPLSHLDFVLWYKETGKVFK